MFLNCDCCRKIMKPKLFTCSLTITSRSWLLFSRDVTCHADAYETASDILTFLFSLFSPSQSMRSSGTTCPASPSTAMRSFPSAPELTQETQIKGNTEQESDSLLFHARTTACRKREEEVRRRTSVHFYCPDDQGPTRALFFSYIKRLFTRKLSKDTSTWLTFFFFNFKHVATKPAVSPRPQRQSMLLEDQNFLYVSFLLQFVNDSVPMSYVICIYSICSVCISGFTERQSRRREEVPFFLKTGNRNMRLEFGLECSTSKSKIKDLSKRDHVKFG